MEFYQSERNAVMVHLNTIGVETRSGFKTIELFQGDITHLEPKVDVLIVSAFAGGYEPTPRSVFGSLKTIHQLDMYDLAGRALLDLRDALGVWISQPLRKGPAKHIACVELVGSRVQMNEALSNVFASLLLFEAKGNTLSSIALPLLGTGYQRISSSIMTKHLVKSTTQLLERSTSISRIQFVELDPKKAERLSLSMDNAMGRIKVSMSREQLTSALLDDLRSKVSTKSTLFSGEGSVLRNEWLQLLQQKEIRSFEFGILARKLVERILNILKGDSGAPLYQRIRDLEQKNHVAPWICGYMNVLRHLGNESAHTSQMISVRRPSVIKDVDLTAGLYCVIRLLDEWPEIEQ